MIKKTPKVSITRTYARDAEKKFFPAIKALSTHLRNTGRVTDDFLGYKVPAGSFRDDYGRKWQYQVYAVCSPGKFIKKEEVVPMVRKWAIGLRLRVISKHIIDNLFKN